MYNCYTYARHTQAISSGPSQYGRQVKRYKTASVINTGEAEPVFDAKNELDTNPDNIYTGAKWRLLSTSGHFCDVYGFRDD